MGFWGVVSLLCLATCDVCLAGPLTGQYFEELRQRQLFGLAERYCLETLAKTDLSHTRRIDFSYELSRTLAAHAFRAEPGEADELWQRAHQVLEQAKLRIREHPRRILLDLQIAFVACAQGHAAQSQVALRPDDGPLRQSARQLLKRGTGELAALEAELKSTLKKSPANVDPEDRLQPAEIRLQLLALNFELGRGLVTLVELSPLDEPDRMSLIQTAEKSLAAALNADRDGETGQASQVLLAACSRLRIDAPKALQQLDNLAQTMPPQAIRDLITGERARVLLMQQKPLEAADLLMGEIQNRDDPPGELVCLRVEVLLQLWLAAEDKQASDLAREFESTIDSQLQRIETTNPGYWAVYCKRLVEQARESKRLGPALAEQVRRARELYSLQQTDAAIEAYASAAKSAADSGHADAALELALTQASIEIADRRFTSALKTLDALLKAHPAHSRIVDVHFLKAHALGQIYAAAATRSNREAYTAQLMAHRARFTAHPTSAEATWLLGQLEEKRLQNSAAIELYQQIPADHPRAPAAAAAVARCYDRLLQRLRELDQPTANWEQAARDWLTARVPQGMSDPVSLTTEQAVMLLHLSNIELQSAQPDFAATERWLKLVAERAAAEPVEPAMGHEGNETKTTPASTQGTVWPQLHRAAARLRVVSLAGQNQFPAAEQTLRELADSNPHELLAIIDGLSTLVAKAQTEPQHLLGELQLHAAQLLQQQRSKLSDAEQVRLERCLAEAYVAAGRYRDGMQPYQQLLAAYPDDLKLKTAYANLLMKLQTPLKTQEAQALWKQIEGRHPAGSAAWFQARWQVAKCEQLSGAPDKALKLINVTRVLFPKLGGPVMQKQFETLEMECRTSQAKE